jgi:formylglycine-generating enzyme required for sulfatase activity
MGSRLKLSAMFADDDRWAATAPAGSFPLGRSKWGTLDMAGNVAEWTADLYAPRRNENPAPKGRVVKGSHFLDDDASAVQTSKRTPVLATERFQMLGFRCARRL